MRLRVLIAERDPALLKSYRDSLSRENFEVAWAGNASSCLTQLTSWQPDLVVLDLALIQAAADGPFRGLEDDGFLQAVPVVILANEPYEPELVGAMADSVRGWLIRPVSAANLGRTIARVFATHPVRSAPETSVWFR